ncbi:MAG: hypothetical protein QXY05_00275 [Candidatus Anstonellales archaeon]
MDRKGQIAMEFFAYSAIFLLALMAISVGIGLVEKIELEGRNAAVAREKVMRVANVIALVGSAEEGFSYRMNLGSDINGIPYRVEIQEGMVHLTVLDGRNTTYPYPTYSGKIVKSGCIPTEKGWYVIDVNKDVLISNNGQEVVLWQEC